MAAVVCDDRAALPRAAVLEAPAGPTPAAAAVQAALAMFNVRAVPGDLAQGPAADVDAVVLPRVTGASLGALGLWPGGSNSTPAFDAELLADVARQGGGPA